MTDEVVLLLVGGGHVYISTGLTKQVFKAGGHFVHYF